jgi:hypothetical protein
MMQIHISAVYPRSFKKSQDVFSSILGSLQGITMHFRAFQPVPFRLAGGRAGRRNAAIKPPRLGRRRRTGWAIAPLNDSLVNGRPGGGEAVFVERSP